MSLKKTLNRNSLNSLQENVETPPETTPVPAAAPLENVENPEAALTPQTLEKPAPGEIINVHAAGQLRASMLLQGTISPDQFQSFV